MRRQTPGSRVCEERYDRSLSSRKARESALPGRDATKPDGSPTGEVTVSHPCARGWSGGRATCVARAALPLGACVRLSFPRIRPDCRPSRPLNGDDMATLRLVLTGCLVIGAVTACQRKAPMDEHMEHMAAGDLSGGPSTNLPTQGDLSLPASNNHAAARL